MQKPNQAALVIIDVFCGQITNDVMFFLKENDIDYVFVSNNMTQLFQPMDLTLFKKATPTNFSSVSYTNVGILPKPSWLLVLTFCRTAVKFQDYT